MKMKKNEMFFMYLLNAKFNNTMCDLSIICFSNNNKIYKKKIKQCMAMDDFQMVVPKLNDNSFIVAMVSAEGNWESFLHIVIDINVNVLTFATGFTKASSRRNGYSTHLRQWVINNIPNISKYESLTMTESKSDLLLEKIGFVKENNKMVMYNDVCVK